MRDGEPADFVTLNERLRQVYGELSPRLRQAARYLLERPEDVALHSMRTVARHAGVHPSTLVRLARELDLVSYNDLRTPFQGWLRAQRAGFSGRALNLQARAPTGVAAGLVRELLAAHHANLDRSFADNPPDRLDAVAQVLVDASRRYFIGLRSCFPVAFALHYACRLVFDHACLLDGRGGTLADDLREIGPGDVLVGASVSPYTRDTIRVVQFAAARGATVVALTDRATSPLAAPAHYTLTAANDGPALLHSVVALLALAEALAALVVARGGAPALDAVGRAEQQLARFDAYLKDPADR